MLEFLRNKTRSSMGGDSGPKTESGLALVARMGDAPRDSDMPQRRRSVETILIELGANPRHVRYAMERRRVTGEALHVIVRDIGLVSAETVARALAIEAGVDYFSPAQADVLDIGVLTKYAKLMSELKTFVPVGESDRGGVVLAVASMQQANEARNHFHEHLPTVVIASETTVQKVFQRYYANTLKAFDESVEAFVAAMKAGRDTDNPGLIQEVICAALRHACYQGASDLYLWRSDRAGNIKIKRNGVGEMMRSLTMEVFERLMNTLVNNVGVGDRLASGPQDTRVEIKSPEAMEKYADIINRYNFRMEIVQAPDGRRNATIRVQDSQAEETDFPYLGFDDRSNAILKRWIEAPTGLVLVTGPTGSGKTTTLYAMLREIDPVERAVFTVENPVEYRNNAWIQHEVRVRGQENEGEVFRGYLKALLREAPDVILYGEMRDDLEVVKTILAAANTGHLVFTTVHTNSAPKAIMRLREMGASNEALAAVLHGVVAQRLVPTLCPHCKRPDTRDSVKTELNRNWLNNIPKTPHIAMGCEHCGGTGRRGRRMVYEILDAGLVRPMIELGGAVSEIEKKGIAAGSSMWARGLALVASGEVSLDDLIKRVDRDSV